MRSAVIPPLPAFCGERVGVRGSARLQRRRKFLPLTLSPLKNGERGYKEGAP